ncbi:hypothetical protein RND71_025156 [Anisodus tanguticus]|uniref:Uncharacterized protein n=1 Tax=Anisodus tanguticus TaxID=243964 RepID=A0AAE1VD64_9SOLA|nr:hypothetical protein RND71_025156 [Anisodus tanguticus]
MSDIESIPEYYIDLKDWEHTSVAWRGDEHFVRTVSNFLTEIQLGLLKTRPFGEFIELTKLNVSGVLLDVILLSEVHNRDPNKGKGVIDLFTLTESEDEITSLEDRVKTSDIERSPDQVGGVRNPIDIVDSPPNDFGGEGFDGFDFEGSVTEVVLDDVAGASTKQVDVCRRRRFIFGNFSNNHLDGSASEVVLDDFGGAATEQVVEEGSLTSGNVIEPVAKKEKWLRLRFKSDQEFEQAKSFVEERRKEKSDPMLPDLVETTTGVDVCGIESTQGESPIGEHTREEHDVLLSDAVQSNSGVDVSEMQVESLIGDVRREEYDESINVVTMMEQVSQQAAFSADGEDHIDEQAIIVYSDVVAEYSILVCNSLTGETVVPESVARGTPRESADIVEESVKFQNTPDIVAQGTSVESNDVGEGSVQSQCGESSEESDDDFLDIMDITSFAVDMAWDIGTPAATETYKR